jgi:chemosensory pili system protein ChpA (sensor histidine kinase/response regulator)
MGDNRSYAALEWVIGEIRETLNQARQTLEVYVGNTEDTARIRFCLTYIHQVHGSLQMVEFHGAALLAEEMEKLAQALVKQSVRDEAEAQEVLMRAILQLPVYLDKVKTQRSDNPAAVLPLLNDLRAVRGESLLTETKLFTPNLAPAHHIADRNAAGAIDPRQFLVAVRKLRQMYQYAAAGVIREIKREENIAYLYKIFARLRKLTKGTARQPLWDISLALLEGLEHDVIESSATVKNLLRQLDNEIKTLASGGVAALNTFSNDELIKNLLYYITRASYEGQHIQRIKQAYKLNAALPKNESPGEEAATAPLDLDAVRSVVNALKDELDTIKQALSLTDQEKADVSEALPIIKRVADTLAVLGIGDLRRQMLAQGELLKSAAEQGPLPAEVLMQVAGKMIEIESALELLASGSGKSATNSSPGINTLDQAQESVLRESRNGLEQAKDAIIEYIASQWNREHLANVPKHLREISGGLEMIPLQKPAVILESCANFIGQQLLEAAITPDWSSLDTLADAIASVEYYLERLTGDREEEDELLLSVAEDSIAMLGYPIAAHLRSPAARRFYGSASPALQKTAGAGKVELVAPPENPARQNVASQADEAAPVTKPWVEIIDAAPQPEVGEENSLSQPDNTLKSESVANAETDELIDEEILEIFTEEAGEVLETINTFFPRWAKDVKDQEALQEIRRAFHTLKGSGRMVNARDIGELAWAVEDMLNRIIDASTEPNDGHAKLIQKVISLLPALVDAFKYQQPNPDPAPVEDLSRWAEALSKGERPEALFAEAPAADAVVDDEDEAPDFLLWDIFNSEALGHLEEVARFIADMDESAPLFTPPSDQMQRALHTLKGSAHMADVTPIAELVAPLERFVKDLRIYQVNIDHDILQLLKDGVEYTQAVLGQIEHQEPLEIPRLAQFLARVAELKERSVAPLIRQREAQEERAKQAVDPELLAIFMAEEMRLLLDVDDIISGWRTNAFDVAEAEPVIAELATLEKGSEHANLPPMAMLSRQLRQIYEAALRNQLVKNEDFYGVLLDSHAELLDMVDAVAVGQNLQPISAELQDSLAEILNTLDDAVNATPSLTSSVSGQVLDDEPRGPIAVGSRHALPETQQPLTASEKPLNEQPSFSETEQSLETERAAPAERAQPLTVAERELTVAERELTVAESDKSRDEEIDLEVFEIFIEEAEELLEQIDESVHDWEENGSGSSHLEALKRALHTLKGGARLAGLMGLGELAHEFESFLISEGENPAVGQPFFEIVHEYQDKLISSADKVKARVAGYMPDGLEEVMQASENFDAQVLDAPVEPNGFAGEQSADEPYTQGQVTEERLTEEQFTEEQFTEKQGNELDIQGRDTEARDLQASENASADILPFAPKSKTPGKTTAVASLPGSHEFAGSQAAAAATARRASPQEVVKISAELLEELVNLAGETSISRGRLEEQNTDLNFAIEEMESTVHRLQEQLRRLDIETEAQMIFRQEQMQEAEEFDPLEMDRYSQLQQLSRSLMESASDLMDLTTTLGDKSRGTETLLLQQSRINTDLQEGLMRSRMVPFARMVPRLRRIVRQISTELGKQVSFELDNVEGELDRSVLERMVAPLEHMLRNAVDHGIESREERLKAGKPETGRIVLSLGREGGDVLMRLADDGGGLNLERIRAKAIERGLMNWDAQLSDHDIMQFILQAGFSTADKITQISGRGVGMDVVHAEIKQLGGSMFIDSRWGEGTEFIIRLPFTVSVNRALMIQLSEDQYAIPLNTIEGIVRVSPFELEHYYQDENARFEYAGENYRVRYLGSMLDREVLPRLEGLTLPMPVVLVRSAEHAVAIQVDRLMGSREIVVKSLGPQFSAVEGLSGATVMGDGSVVVILDPNAMIRKEMALLTPTAKLLEAVKTEGVKEEARIQRILVVDDSVTVRKVTSRFLEREGYEVMTAKDGADALLTLQDHIPDLMLLDIEMPRMDGFEVAKNVRSSGRLKNVPIIMITSRTGEKHRERAFGLGVNKYLGKPYQEELLLSNIQELIGVPAEA